MPEQCEETFKLSCLYGVGLQLQMAGSETFFVDVVFETWPWHETKIKTSVSSIIANLSLSR